jgi:hypothetical protein
MQGGRGEEGRKRDGGGRGRALASKGEISKKVQNKMTKNVPGTEKRPEYSKEECGTKAKPRAKRQGRRCESRGYTRHGDRPVSGRFTSRLRGGRIGIQWDVKNGRGASVCACRRCVERQVANVVGNARPKWKVCHAMAICLALSQLRPEATRCPL